MPGLPGEHRMRSLVTVELGHMMAALFSPEKLKAAQEAAPGRVIHDTVVVEENYIITTHRNDGKWDFTIEHDGAVNRYPGQVLERLIRQRAAIIKKGRRDAAQRSGQKTAEDVADALFPGGDLAS